MNEVTKLYENAGIKKDWAAIGFGDIEDCYPPFTAEKQLLLIQWLLDKTDLYLHRHKSDFTYSITTGDISVNKNKDFKESIAEFINAIWQYLTEEERKQIKEILSE